MRHWVCCAWSVCIAIALCATAAAEVPEDDLMLLMISEPKPVLEKLYQRDLDGAKALADKLVQSMPDNEVPFLLRSRIHQALADEASARRDLQTAYGNAPDSLQVAYEFASFSVRVGHLDAAKEVQAELDERRIDNFWAELIDVHLLIGQGQLKAASDTFRASKLNSSQRGWLKRFSKAYTETEAQLGLAYLEQDDLWSGIAHLNSALDGRPADAPALLMRLGDALEADGRLVQAQQLYESFPQRRYASAYPELLEESQARVAAVKQALADRAALEQRNEPLAKELVAVIDAYRRDPGNAGARAAAIQAVWPLYTIGDEPTPGEMILRIGQAKPTDIEEPEAVRTARESSDAMYRDRAGEHLYQNGPTENYAVLRGQVLAIYPKSDLLHRQAIEDLARGAYDEAAQHAMLAEAVSFAEIYYDRTYLGTHIQNAQQTRAIARLASHGEDRSAQNDTQLALTVLLHTERKGDYVEADRLREQLKDDLTAAENNRLWRVLAWRGAAHRKLIEADYAEAYDSAWKRGQIGILGRMAKRLVSKDIHDDRLAAGLMGYSLMNGDPALAETYLNQLLKRNPHNAYAWRALGENALIEGRDAKALLYYNTAVQCINKTGKPERYADILPEIEGALTKLEKDLGPDLANAYWQRAGAHETSNQKLAAPRWKPVIEAAVMRVLQVAPDNASLYNLLAQFRADVGDHAGAIEAAELGLKHDPDKSGVYHYRIGNAYAARLPATTIHRDQLKANYLLAMDAFQKALETGVINEMWVKATSAKMYKDVGMIDEAIDAYRFVAEQTDAVKTRAQAYFWLAKLQHEHNKAELPELIKNLHAAINAYDAIQGRSYAESQSRRQAKELLDKVSGVEE